VSKPVSLSIPLIVLVAIGAVFAVMEAGRVPDWQIELAEYAASHQHPTATVRVRSVAPARRPWNYRPEMGQPVVDDTEWGAAELPYPPKRVMCALLESQATARSPTRESAYQVVYICHHSDTLWKYGWVIHESRGAPSSEAIQEQVSALGCDLELAQFTPEQPPPPRSPDRTRDLLPLVFHLPGNT
jgi:hypothetical protein